MHPLARVFQIVFLTGGLILAGLGYIVYYDDFQQNTSVSLAWECEVQDGKESCTISQGSLDSGSYNEGYINIAAGAVLILAGAAVSIGGRRRAEQPAPAIPQQAFPGSQPAPPTGAPAPAAPPRY